ncbi:unnamed protein product [Cyprideis torosa]|uniref:Uncharacterized protein n=1 Tax=Cyprideis torosa TaxID=163714 RepID=A0A7R8WJG1_9CRUS|nr:unnamed protein product [Cyprideis torosa]CAG0899142.1 unnamed protein product [Cyprideis torosa]
MAFAIFIGILCCVNVVIVTVINAQSPPPPPTTQDLREWERYWVQLGDIAGREFPKILSMPGWLLKDEDELSGVKVYEANYTDNIFGGKYTNVIQKAEATLNAPLRYIFGDFHFKIEKMGDWSPIMKPGDTKILARSYPQAPVPLPPRHFTVLEKTMQSKDASNRPVFYKVGLDVELPRSIRIPPEASDDERRAFQGVGGIVIVQDPSDPSSRSKVTFISNMDYVNPAFPAEDCGSEETLTNEDCGSEETLTNEDCGSEETLTNEDCGSEETLTNEDCGSEETLTNEDCGSEETLTNEDCGSEETLTNEDCGSEETLTNEDCGSEETLTNEDCGSEETLTNEDCGSEETLTNEDCGSEETLTNEDCGSEETLTNEDCGSEETLTNEDCGSEETLTNEDCGSEETLTNEDCGSEETLTNEDCGSEET